MVALITDNGKESLIGGIVKVYKRTRQRDDHTFLSLRLVSEKQIVDVGINAENTLTLLDLHKRLVQAHEAGGFNVIVHDVGPLNSDTVTVGDRTYTNLKAAVRDDQIRIVPGKGQAGRAGEGSEAGDGGQANKFDEKMLAMIADLLAEHGKPEQPVSTVRTQGLGQQF